MGRTGQKVGGIDTMKKHIAEFYLGSYRVRLECTYCFTNKEIMNTYTWQQRLRARLFGRIKTKLGQYNNGNQAQFYLAHCKKHGYFESTLHGHAEYMICPICELEYNWNRSN